VRDLFADVVPFVAVAEAGSFRAAAASLGVTPAAVSKAVARLEGRVGAQLLLRSTRRVSLSDEGRLFLGRCQAAIRAVEDGRGQLARSGDAVTGDVSLSTSFVFGRFLVQRVARLVSAHPALRLHLRFTDRQSELIGEGVDVAVRVGDLPDSSLVGRKLVDTRWVTVAAPAYLSQWGTPRSVDDLESHRAVRFRSPRGVAVPWSFQSARAPDMHLSLDVDQGELLLDAALAGVGVCQVFSFMVVDQLESGELIEILHDQACPGPPVHALCLPGQQRVPRVRAALDFLGEAFAEAATSAQRPRPNHAT